MPVAGSRSRIKVGQNERCDTLISTNVVVDWLIRMNVSSTTRSAAGLVQHWPCFAMSTISLETSGRTNPFSAASKFRCSSFCSFFIFSFFWVLMSSLHRYVFASGAEKHSRMIRSNNIYSVANGDSRYQFWREESHCSTKFFPSAERKKEQRVSEKYHKL